MINKNNITLIFTICGVIIDDRFTSKIITVKKCIYKTDKKEYKNCISIYYHFSLKRTITQNEKKLHLALFRESMYFVNIFHLLLTRPSQLLHITYQIEDKKISIEPHVKEFPSHLYNLANDINYSINPVIAKLSTHTIIEGWKLFEKIIKKFTKKSKRFKDSIYLALRWIQKGCDETNSVDRLISLWIAFNSLYQNSIINDEKEAIKRYITDNLTLESAEVFFQRNEFHLKYLSKHNIYIGRATPPRNVSKNLADALKTTKKQYLKIIKLAMLCVYGIRNSLFHGSINLDDNSQLTLIEYVETLVGEFLKEVLCSLILGKPLPNINLRGEEQLGF